jgi:hypothetical protein
MANGLRPVVRCKAIVLARRLHSERLVGSNHQRMTTEGNDMAHDWAQDVKKYVSSPDEAAIKGIVRHLGIALQSRDASFVACEDKSERNRVRDSFLKKKLALIDAAADLDKAIMDVCQKMKADRDKSRVAFYYLLAERYGKLAQFH